MDALLGFFLIIFPIALALVLLVFLKKAADITGVIVWFVTLIIAIVAFQTDIGIALTASVAGIVDIDDDLHARNWRAPKTDCLLQDTWRWKSSHADSHD